MRIQTTLALAFVALVGTQAHAFDPDDQRGARVAVEAGVGIGGAAVGVVVGGLTGILIGELADECDRSWGCFPHALFGGAIGGVVGLVSGVYLGGYAMGANGGAGWTVLGGAGGIAVAGGLQLLVGDQMNGLVAAIMWVTLPLTGSILGYELSTNATGPDALHAPLVLALPPITF